MAHIRACSHFEPDPPNNNSVQFPCSAQRTKPHSGNLGKIVREGLIDNIMIFILIVSMICENFTSKSITLWLATSIYPTKRCKAICHYQLF